MSQNKDKKAYSALKQNLKNRLRTKIKMHSVSRGGGSSQDVQNVLNKFNDGDDEKLELMKDIQEGVKGMKQKDAKKYLKNVISGMNTEQTDHFVDMVNDKLPTQSRDIVNYVKKQKKVKNDEKKDNNQSTPTQPNPDTVYVPTRLRSKIPVQVQTQVQGQTQQLLSEEDKQKAQAQAQPSTKPLKKKAFKKIQIAIPKITELKGQEIGSDKISPKSVKNLVVRGSRPISVSSVSSAPGSVPSSTQQTHKKHQPVSHEETIQNINQIFPELTPVSSKPQVPTQVPGQPIPQPTQQQLSYAARLKHITHFNIRHMEKQRLRYILEASDADAVHVVTVSQVDKLPLIDFLPVPNTEETVMDSEIPGKHQTVLLKQDLSFDKNEMYGYRKIQEKFNSFPFERIKYVRIKNAHLECIQYLKTLNVVFLWLQGIKGKKVLLSWFYGQLANLGILQQKVKTNSIAKQDTYQEYFHVICQEYLDIGTQKTNSPLVPFCKIMFKL